MFIRYVCHEMRSPLNSTMLGMQCLEEKLTERWNQKQQLSLEDILCVVRDAKEACGAAVETLDDMLTSDKIRSGLLQLDMTEIKLLPPLQALVQSFQSTVRKIFRDFQRNEIMFLLCNLFRRLLI